jgi:hypothetical protein
MYTVRQVLNPEFTRTWQEAVAIVQEAASLLQPGLALPDPEDLILHESGTLSFGFGSESSRHPVVGLATLLNELLQGVEAPESLIALTAQNIQSEPTNSSIDAFSRALSFYERPNRTNDLRSVVGRLRGKPAEKSSVELEFERLREKVAGPAIVEEQPQPRPAEPVKRRVPKLTRTQQQVVAAGIIAGVLLGVMAIQGSPLPRLRGAYDRVEAGLSGTISAGLDRLGVSQSASASPAPAAAATSGNPAAPEPVEKNRAARSTTRSASAVSARHSGSGNTTSGSTAAATSLAPKTPDSAGASDRHAEIPTPGLASRSLSPPTVRTEPAAVSPVAAPVAPAVPELATATPAPLAMPPNGIYSPETPGVTPPVLTRPQMPKEPAPGDDTGYFEIVVDEKGSPELVKLISPRRRYHDRMLVAAAKAWQFRPATLDGRPVKYRLLVPIILSGLPY